MKVIILKSLTGVFFFVMLLMNYLANALPLNQRNTGEISDMYPSYFTPSGFTFSIWGVIYILLSILLVKILITPNSVFFIEYPEKLIYLFIASSILNALWLVAWHYDYMIISSVVMILLFGALIWIAFYIPSLDTLTKTAFSIYAGWISIALIANITITLIKLNIPLFQNNEVVWYIIIMVVGVVIGVTTLVVFKNFPYYLVFIWAYFGIFMKHLNQSGYHLGRNYILFNGTLLATLMLSGIVLFILNNYKFFEVS